MGKPPVSIQLHPPGENHVRSIPLDIVLALLTCGLWNIYLQHRHMVAINAMLGREKYRFLPWFLLTLVTCGLYHIYHEYQKSLDLGRLRHKTDTNEAIACLVLTIFGLSIVANAIQQRDINEYFGGHEGV